MRAAETVLKTRLLVHFEVLNYEYPLEEDVPPHPFPGALLSAIDLIEEIERSHERVYEWTSWGPHGNAAAISETWQQSRQRSKFPLQVDALRGGSKCLEKVSMLSKEFSLRAYRIPTHRQAREIA